MKPLIKQNMLAVETCTTACSVALWDGNTLHETMIDAERAHSQQILPLCESLLAHADLSMQDIDAIACTRGPGAFTGLRIGVGVAKGLAFGQDLPIYAVSSLTALAYRVMQQAQAKRVFALLDARMGELYAGEYENHDGMPHLIGEERLVDVGQLTVGEQVFAGTGAHEYAEALVAKGANLSDIRYPMASDVIALAQQGQAQSTTAATLSPTYLRNKVTY